MGVYQSNNSNLNTHKIGPFGVLPIRDTSIIELHPFNTYRAKGLSKYYEYLGATSIQCPITFTPYARQLLHIPKTAVSFVWAYPLSDLPEGIPEVPESPEHLMVRFGGFVYIDANDKVVGVNALTLEGNALSFLEGVRLDDEVLVKHLKREHQWHSVPMEPLQKYLKKFCWFSPHGTRSNGESLGKHGGFIYIDNANNSLYFSIEEPQPPNNTQ
eukprot:TRINITY_DN20808_c0_g2_i4.p1 TRINITY_DN20808_c0_g2~~TRINITY_DN20808_c0_g2_i4.p1  ORF type:complete len:214 (+),score=42.49 TRINITY_DN20808_c0_g2_i4:314-955(+)